MVAPLDMERAQLQHDLMAQAYRDAGAAVHYVFFNPNPHTQIPTRCLQLMMFMTPEGAILAHPAGCAGRRKSARVQGACAFGIPIVQHQRARDI